MRDTDYAYCVARIRANERYLLKEKDLPTAIFCMNDMLAIELIRCLQKHKISVPGDISVIAIDDLVLSDMIWPSLTTVAIDKEQLGSGAVDVLMDLINGRETHSIVVTANNVIRRESVAKLPG